MRKTGAILLGMFTLLLSLESSFGMHFCHDVLVETSMNRQMKDCCGTPAKSKHADFNKECCEITYFTADFDDATVSQADIALSQALVFTPIIQFEVNTFHSTATSHFVWREPPPNPHHVSLHILFEQYLI